MSRGTRPVRIANCSGFYGDRLSAAQEMVDGGPIDVLTGDGFMDNVVARGEQLREGLTKLAATHSVIADVRGPGLMVAAEFRDPTTGAPDAARVAAVLAHCRDHANVLLMNAGSYGNVIRFMPPLIVNEAEMSEALAALGDALAATV